MTKAIRMFKTGGPEVMEYVDVEVGDPGPGEVRIRHAAVGLNFIDVYFRIGLYPQPLPSGLGQEGAGTIEAVGAGVTDFKVGDRVAYAGRPNGAYAEARVMPADILVKLPDSISFDTAAAMMLQGMTVQYLLRQTYPLKGGETILLHAAAGGIGLIACQWAKALGVTVIGTVSTDEKAAFAARNGADHTIFYRREDVVARTRELTKGRGVDLVLDHVCGPEFSGYLGALAKWGTLVSYNAFAGLPEDNLMAAMRNHLDICPAVRCFSFHIYDDDRDGRRALMGEVIAALDRGEIRPAISARFKLAEVRKAHTLLEQGAALGKIIMTP